MTSFRKGIFTGIALYVLAILFTVLTHYMFGYTLQGPPASVMVFLFFVLVGIYRLFKTAIYVSRLKEKRLNLGEMYVHLSFFSLLFLFFAYVVFLV